MSRAIVLVLLAFSLASADVSACACDPMRPETMAVRQCSLCNEAEKQPADIEYFFLKDNNPRKPNRWLILPRTHDCDGVGTLGKLPAAQRMRLWKAAIERASEMWGDQWGLAINGDQVRTQCHGHIHIGRLLKGVETNRFIVVSGPEHIPVPQDGTGLWVHPHGDKLHVHLGEQTTETVLFR